MWCGSSSEGKLQLEHRQQHKSANLCTPLLGWKHDSYQKHNLGRNGQGRQRDGMLQRHCENKKRQKKIKKPLCSVTVKCQSYRDVCEQLQWIRACLPALQQVAHWVWPAWSWGWWRLRCVGGQYIWYLTAGLVNVFCKPIVSHYCTTSHQLAIRQFAVIRLVVIACSCQQRHKTVNIKSNLKPVVF